MDLLARGVIDIPGPWNHRHIAANGTRLHVAEAGDGPLVVFLHGFPEFWWAWRHQLPAVADAGYRAVAVDLRGYGGSDKTPRGYDPATSSADVAGLIRSLGASRATVIGHGWGGYIAWATAVLHAQHVAAVGTVSAPHPLWLRHQTLRSRAQMGSARHVLGYQMPILPERRLMADNAAHVDVLLRRWAGPNTPFPTAEESRRYRAAMQLWPAPHCALEYYRWLVRSTFRRDGRRFAAQMRDPITVPVLRLHGALDQSVLASSAEGSAEYVTGPYRWRRIDGVGHFPHEESPDDVTKQLLDWLAAEQPPTEPPLADPGSGSGSGR